MTRVEEAAQERPAGDRRWQRWRWRLLGGVAVVAVNALFYLVVDRAAVTRHHLLVTLQGSTVTAAFDDAPLCAWQPAPEDEGRLGIVLQPEFSSEPAGLDNLVVRALPSGHTVVQDDYGRGFSGRHSASGWYTNRRGHLVADRTVPLWIDGASCRDCVIEVDLINVRGFDLFVRARERNALVLRWENETLSWHEQRDGVIGPPQHVVRLLPSLSLEQRYDRYTAKLAAYLAEGYVDGWRFVAWYARAAAPGVVGLLALAALSYLLPQRVRKRFATVRRRDWLSNRGTAAGIGAFSAAAVGFYWWRGGAGMMGIAAASALAGCAGVLGGLVAGEVRQLRTDSPARYRRLGAVCTTVCVTVLCAAAAGFSAYVALVYLEGIPHVQDSVSYLLGAKAIATGQLKIPVDPALGEFFRYPDFLEYRAGYLYPIAPGWYFAGHPTLLALGYLIGLPWIVNPISSAITLAVLFLICRELFGTTTGLLALALGAVSPFMRFQAASMMTHTSTLLFVALSMLFLIYWVKRGRLIYACYLGAAFGALLNTRPFDGTAVMAFAGLVVIANLRRLGVRQVLQGGCVVALALLPFLILMLWQIETLGALTTLQQTGASTMRWIPENIDAARIRLEALNDHLFGWVRVGGLPPMLTVGILLFGVLVMPKTPADWLVAAWALLSLFLYASWGWHGNMYGPRYWYTSLGGQLILVARVLQYLPRLVTRLLCAVWPAGRTPQWHWLPFAAGALPMALVVVPLFVGTIVIAYPKGFKPEYTYPGGYNGFSAAPLQLLARHGITHGLIFVADLPRWQDLLTCLGSNDATLNSDLLFARHIEGRNHLLMQARPGHPPYLITWNGSELELGELRLDPATQEAAYTALRTEKPDPRGAPDANLLRGLPGPALLGGMAVSSRGDIYVVDGGEHAVLVFDRNGDFVRRIRVSYSFGTAAITSGHGLAVDDEGNVYVANLDPPGLIRFNPDGRFAWRAVRSPDGQQQLRRPLDVSLLPNGDLVVSDADTSHLHRVQRDGTVDGYLGKDFRTAYGVAAAANGHIFVSDVGQQALIELDSTGTEVRRWTLRLDHVEPYSVPYVAVDARNHAYVANFEGFVVYHADPAKSELELIGGTIVKPSGVAVDGDRLLVITAPTRQAVPVPLLHVTASRQDAPIDTDALDLPSP